MGEPLEWDEWRASLPRCHACGEPISDDMCLYDEDGNQYHRDGCCRDGWVDAMLPQYIRPTFEE